MKTHIAFTSSPIVPPASSSATREIGAVLEFSGVVRELENGKKIPGLRYEAYEPMARTQLERICAELAAKHAGEELWFIHRLEFVPVGEPSLFIRIHAGHRGPALALMAELIDRLKADVPVWKISDNLH